MPKRRWQYDLQISDTMDNPWLPRTPTQQNQQQQQEQQQQQMSRGKRRRRVSDIIDSMGESGHSSNSSSGSVYSSPACSSRYGSPYSASPTTSAVCSTPRLTGTPVAEGFVTPQRPPRPHWNSAAVSPDQGYSTPESIGVYTPEYSCKKIELRDASGPDPHTDNYSYLMNETSVKMSVQKDSNLYNMNHRNRGKCVIFNHEVFDTGFDVREGSSVDARRIEQTFQRLGFTVEICNDYEHSSIMSKITELSEEDHTDNDCICIFVLTHGLKNDFICAKDVVYKLENIWKPFTAERCVTLAGKPKLFFFQACRGDNLDGGVRMCRSLMTETDSSINSYKIPTHADFLLAYSTVEGFYSWRNPEEGTWYIQSLCDVLDEYGSTTDLGHMLTITARKVATDFASYNNLDPTLHDLKQVPTVTSSLIRDVHFTSKNG